MYASPQIRLHTIPVPAKLAPILVQFAKGGSGVTSSVAVSASTVTATATTMNTATVTATAAKPKSSQIDGGDSFLDFGGASAAPAVAATTKPTAAATNALYVALCLFTLSRMLVSLHVCFYGYLFSYVPMFSLARCICTVPCLSAPCSFLSHRVLTCALLTTISATSHSISPAAALALLPPPTPTRRRRLQTERRLRLRRWSFTSPTRSRVRYLQICMRFVLIFVVYCLFCFVKSESLAASTLCVVVFLFHHRRLLHR